MTKKNTTPTAVFDFPVEVKKTTRVQVESEPEPDDERWTKVPLFRPLIRGDKETGPGGITTGPGEPCIDCARLGIEDSTHQFHLQCWKDADGRWRGPDAAEIVALIGSVHHEYAKTSKGQELVRTYVKGGFVAGTEVEQEWRATRRREFEREGPDAAQPGTGDAGMFTLEDMRRGMNMDLGADRKTNNPQIERDLRLEEAGQLRRAVQDGLASGMGPVVELIRDLLAERKSTEA